jgi:hypothetical protein
MTAEQLPAHPRIWWDGHDFLYLRTGSALQAGEDGQLHRRGPGLYRAERVEDILTPEARPVVELHAAAVPDTGQADDPLRLRWEVQQLQGVVQDQHRAIAAVRSLCADAMKLPTLEDPRPADDRVSPRAVLAALDRAGSGPDTGQPREPDTVTAEIHNLLGSLAARSTPPDELTDAAEHVIRTNVRNGRPTSAHFVGLVLAALDQARAATTITVDLDGRPQTTLTADQVARLHAQHAAVRAYVENAKRAVAPFRAEWMHDLLHLLDEAGQ